MLTLGHSPDPDDAFLTYPIISRKIPYPPGIDIREIVLDIETLNKLAIVERIDITAASVGAYLIVSKKYLLIPYGASIGYDYGPKLLIRKVDRNGTVVAVPGKYTTARILTEIYLREEKNIENIKLIDVQFEKIKDLVIDGLVDCGVLIHEEQMESFNIENIDLGRWWKKRTGLPIPLGVDIVHERVGTETAREISEMFRKAIEYSYRNVDEVLKHAMKYSRLRDPEKVLQFIKMYVKDTKLTRESPEVRAMIELHRLCKRHDIRPFSETELDIRIIE
ncbi:MAG: ABC transporter substrate-binding protein [Crenarchaeota archaeon]|nr:ABC transporter substrate-binding protein [Thermoproteota archaeon]